jgi:hypothetical protein
VSDPDLPASAFRPRTDIAFGTHEPTADLAVGSLHAASLALNRATSLLPHPVRPNHAPDQTISISRPHQ